METSEITLLDSFKSKKSLSSSLKPPPSDQTTNGSDQNPWSSKTPEKPANPPRRVQARRTAMSIKEVREVAQKLQKGHDRPQSVSSAQQQIAPSWQSESPVAKSKKVNGSVKLPEKYEILGKFFDSLDSSLRLLRLKGYMSTFTNISPKIECLTDRRFSHGHLAQLKFILPEAIEIKKILVHDERTSCMKPDLHVTLNAIPSENDGKLKTGSGNSNLRKVFRSRLLDFAKAHPEGDEIPEETLPEPFNHPKQNPPTKMARTPASHLSQFFQRRFSQKVTSHEAMNINQETPIVSLPSSVHPDSRPVLDQSSSKEDASAFSVPSPIKISSKAVKSQKDLALATPTKGMNFTQKEDSSSMGTGSTQATPAKFASTPAKLMSATPALQPPKRSFMTPDDKSTSSPSKLERRPARSRSLKFDTPVKNAKANDEVNEIEALSVDSDIFDILPENLLQSIREKEKKAMEEKDPAISQAKWRKQMIVGLPKLFDMVHFLFQSIKRSVITKEELMHRIIASHLDIVDRREVEEQLRLLQELAPEWIYEKLATSGDFLLCINKIVSPESIRARLAEAN